MNTYRYSVARLQGLQRKKRKKEELRAICSLSQGRTRCSFFQLFVSHRSECAAAENEGGLGACFVRSVSQCMNGDQSFMHAGSARPTVLFSWQPRRVSSTRSTAMRLSQECTPTCNEDAVLLPASHQSAPGTQQRPSCAVSPSSARRPVVVPRPAPSPLAQRTH